MAVLTTNSRKSAWSLALAASLMAGLLSGCASVDSVLGAVGLQRIPSTGPAPVIRVDPMARVEPVAPVAASWTGTYRGTLPCADCAGLSISLSLFKDATYELQTEMLGTDQRHTRSGSFTFNADETRITLDASGQSRSFDILPPNRLRMLGRDALPVTGPDAERFILRK